MRKENDLDFEIIDLDATDEDAAPVEDPPRKRHFRINIHMVLIAVVLLTLGVIIYKFSNWGVLIDPNDPANLMDEEYYVENLDSMLPLTDEGGNMLRPNTEDGLSIAIFGNGPFAEDRDAENGLAAMLADEAGATVYNYSIADSYLAESSESLPMNMFTFYWLSLLACDIEVNDYFTDSLELLGTDAPPYLASLIKDLRAADLTTMDAIVVMYDASDYFLGRPVFNPENPTDISTFTGNLTAGLALMKQYLPNTRIIVMSPTYAFSDQLDENGDYISSDIVRYGENPLSDYVQHMARCTGEQQLTFVDNFYVTFNEDNALDYLEDNMHLNAAGRKRVIERLLYALNYYGTYYKRAD